jgi:DNA-binding NarL/FixJ family response regulator
MPPIRVAVLAASETVQAGLEALLASCEDLRVVSGDRREGGLAPRRPGSRPACDVLVVAEGRGLRAAQAGGAAPAVVCLSEDPDAAARLAAAGPPAWALLAPGAGRQQLAAAVRAVHRGLVALGQPLAPGWFPPRSAGGAAGGRAGRPPGEEPRLTPREREVLGLLAQGLGNKQIAWELAVSEHTVKYHVSSLYAKLGAGNRTEALRLGIERGLLSL